MRYSIFLFGALWAWTAWAEESGVLDLRARSAPDFQSPAELAAYLTKGLNTEKDKARVLAAWMVYRLERDGFRHQELIRWSNKNRAAPEALDNQTFETRIGTPQDFARLFQTLGSAVGLNVHVIDGFAARDIAAFRYQTPVGQAIEVLTDHWLGSYHLQRYQASWNAVWADEEWHLVDTYWMIADQDLYAARSIQNRREMSRLLKRRIQHLPSRQALMRGKQIDSRYFFAKPSFFIRTHYPYQAEWQLMPVPWTWASFVNR